MRLRHSHGARPASVFSRSHRSVNASSKVKSRSANRRSQNDLGWQLIWQSPSWPGPAAVRQMCLRRSGQGTDEPVGRVLGDMLGDLETEDQVGGPW